MQCMACMQGQSCSATHVVRCDTPHHMETIAEHTLVHAPVSLSPPPHTPWPACPQAGRHLCAFGPGQAVKRGLRAVAAV